MNNSLKSNYPKIAKEWDSSKNKFTPSEVPSMSHKKVWWVCSKKHSYEMRISNRTALEQKCPYCSHQKAGYGNDLKSNYPKIAKEWNTSKNGYGPEKALPMSSKKVWWTCPMGHEYTISINKRTLRGNGCQYCSRRKIGYGNDFASNYPELLKEWDFKKNDRDPSKISPGIKTKFWWICPKKHSFSSGMHSRTHLNTNCPYCTNQKVGYGNDLKTKFPNIAKEWNYDKNLNPPSDYLPMSNKKVWWICPKFHTYETVIASRTHLKTNCPFCTLTPRSREEIYLMFELGFFFECNVDDHKIKLDKIYDVDIKLSNEKIVIEYDGSYWHKDKAELDKNKTKQLQKAGWTVIRVREKPLKILSRKYNVLSSSMNYKDTANKVLKKIHNLGYEVSEIDKYLNRKTLMNKDKADKYINELYREKIN